MPFIRDFSQSYTTSTSGTTIVVPIPAYEAGDLLLAVLTADTGTGTWSASGWTEYFRQTNTSQLCVLYKIAGASESDTTFTCTAAETYNGSIISVGDVNTTTPFHVNANKNSALARDTMPTVTTTIDNCLILYLDACSAAAVPSIIEGNAHLIFGKDGSAHSDGAAWGFQGLAGATPTVKLSRMSASVGKLATIAIAPPSGGATVIPSYTAADASVYLTPFTGAAFNTDLAAANTVTTDFGTTLNGKTLAAGGTTVTTADTGLNSYHATTRLTGLTTSGTYAGIRMQFAAANKPNISNKNLLLHGWPYLPVEIQTTDSVSLTGAMGVAIGLCSAAATNYKWWHVGGANTPWGVNNHVPMIIHPDAAAGVIQNKGSLDPASIYSVGLAVSGKNVAPDWNFGSLWALDTITIAGGGAATPVDIPGIAFAVGMAHERRSAIQQGSSQLMPFQPIQFGNGGTSPIYLDLNATAIEFPKQYDKASKQVNYNSVDNFVGITYYAGAADTIKHRNSVVSSASKFHWRIHSSSSAAATYDFSGLSVIGAGDVVLQAVTTFTGMSFVSCPAITQNSAVISNCSFTGSYITSNTPASISGCRFTSGGSGHAIEITTPGAYSFSGNIFTGYGSTGTADAAIYNNSGGAVTINISGGGSTPTYRNGSGASTTVNNTINITITGLVTGSDVTVLRHGTETVLYTVEDIAGTTAVYSYGTAEAVDISVYKPGYMPAYQHNYTLPSSDGSLPITQVPDPSYLE